MRHAPGPIACAVRPLVNSEYWWAGLTLDDGAVACVGIPTSETSEYWPKEHRVDGILFFGVRLDVAIARVRVWRRESLKAAYARRAERGGRR